MALLARQEQANKWSFPHALCLSSCFQAPSVLTSLSGLFSGRLNEINPSLPKLLLAVVFVTGLETITETAGKGWGAWPQQKNRGWKVEKWGIRGWKHSLFTISLWASEISL